MYLLFGGGIRWWFGSVRVCVCLRVLTAGQPVSVGLGFCDEFNGGCKTLPRGPYAPLVCVHSRSLLTYSRSGPS